MVEDTGSVIGKGFDTWKNNLSICLPFVFSAILTHIVAIIMYLLNKRWALERHFGK